MATRLGLTLDCDMPPAEYDLTVYESEDLSLDLTLYDVQDQAVDLTGYSAVMTARTGPGGTVIFTLSSGAGDITLGGTAGTVNVAVAQSVVTTWDFDVDRGVYELQLVDGSGGKEVILRGQVFMVPGVV